MPRFARAAHRLLDATAPVARGPRSRTTARAATSRGDRHAPGHNALVELLVLNHNARALLAECLPSIVAAADRSRYACRVRVIDNASTDDSCDWLATHYPQVMVERQPNRGLCSFNEVLRRVDVPVAVLLNNDVRLAADAVDPLVEPLLASWGWSWPANWGSAESHAESSPPERGGAAVRPNECLFLTAAQTRSFDGSTYEGQKTAVTWRWGLVQATSLFDGHQHGIHVEGPTASAGAVIAVRRDLFLRLGGFDPLYLPGRLEDLDLAFRAYQAGLACRYVPTSRAFHRGMASFGPAWGDDGCAALALRNTLLFQWKNLRAGQHRLRCIVGLAVRLVADLLLSAWRPRGARFALLRAVAAACSRWRAAAHDARAAHDAHATRYAPHTSESTADRRRWQQRERQFFSDFSPRALSERDLSPCAARDASVARRLSWRMQERRRAAAYPLSRWYVRPAAVWFAQRVAATRLRPWHLTLAGLAASVAGAALLAVLPALAGPAALLAGLAWFCDRADGPLARLQGRATRWGAWLDGNVDELCEVAWHVALAAAAMQCASSTVAMVLPAGLLVAFLSGKYLFSVSCALEAEQAATRAGSSATEAADAAETARTSAAEAASIAEPAVTASRTDLRRRPRLARAACHVRPRRPRGDLCQHRYLRYLYHLPGHADVRLHLLLAALASGWFTAELALVAAYYNARWIVRYALVARRLKEVDRG